MASVYLITNTANGKRYVGFTTQDVACRWRQHRSEAKVRPSHALHLAIRKYGLEAFEVRTLATDMTDERALWLESELVRELGTMAPAGYNLTTGGEGSHPSDETREKIAACLRGRKQSPELVEARIAPLRGRKRPEVVAKSSAAKRAGNAAVRDRALFLVAAGVSGKQAAKFLGASVTSVNRWVREARDLASEGVAG